MLGHLMEWFYEGLGGISQTSDGIGFQHILIRPQIVGDIKQATVNYQSIQGLIQTDWKKTNGFELNLQIPANTIAIVEIPANLRDLVLESDKSLTKIPDLKIIERTAEKIVVSIGSGAYHFKVKQP